MRKLLLWMGALLLTMTITIIGVRQLGSHRPDALASMLGNASANTQACWYTICPGETSRQQTLDVLKRVAEAHATNVVYDAEQVENGYSIRYDACTTATPLHWIACIKPDIVIDDHDYMVDILLHDSDIQLSDVIARLGAPSIVWMCSGLIPSSTYTGARGVNVYLLYNNGISVAAFKQTSYSPLRYPTPPDEWRFRLNMQVYNIEYYAVNAYYRGSRIYFPWRGFSAGPAIRYGCGN